MRNQQDPTAAAVRAMLAYHDKTQIEAAAVLGLSQAGVSRRLGGLTEFQPSELRTLAAWLGVSPAQLLGNDDMRTAS